MKSATSECPHPYLGLVLLPHKHHDATAWQRGIKHHDVSTVASSPEVLWCKLHHKAILGAETGLQNCPSNPSACVSDSLRLQFYVTSLFTVSSAAALFPNSVFLLILPLQNSIGFFMLLKLVFFHLKLPCNSPFDWLVSELAESLTLKV